jgi:hypothetical protein
VVAESVFVGESVDTDEERPKGMPPEDFGPARSQGLRCEAHLDELTYRRGTAMNRKVIDMLVSAIGAVMGFVLLAAAGLLFYAHGYVHGQVADQLKQQQIVFPAAGSKSIASLPAADQAAITQYAGQTMENGDQAKAFADHYIKVHLAEVADGQTYSQVSAKAQADQSNQQLAGQVQTLFRGETLRGLLLNAYAFDTMGTVALIAAWISLAAGLFLLLLATLGLRHGRRTTHPQGTVAATRATVGAVA